MTISKTKKRILLIALPTAVVVIALAVVLWLVLGRSEPEPPFTILRSQTTGEVVSCQLAEGAVEVGDPDSPQPYYNLTPPAGWTQTQQAQILDPYNNADPDVFQSQDGTKMYFLQHRTAQSALNGLDLDPSAIQEVQFGDLQVIYSQNTQTAWDGGQQVSRTETLVFWVQNKTLFCLSCDQAWEINQMLEWITFVDDQNPRMLAYEPPPVEPLELVRGDVQVTELENGRTMSSLKNYRSQGNPEIPDNPAMFTFPQAPEGWTLVGKAESQYTPHLEKYVDDQGEILALVCVTGTKDLFQNYAGTTQLYLPFAGMSRSELEDPNSVQDAAVNGNPAFVHITDDVSEIGWIDGYCTLELRSTAPLSQEELVALAEQVVQEEDIQ